jgi:hypothetical protein
VSNQVQLSTYADAIGGNLGDLTLFLRSDELQGTVLHLELPSVHTHDVAAGLPGPCRR